MYLHDLTRVPEYGIVMEISCRVEPKAKFHLSTYNFSISTSSDIHICLQNIRFILCCSKEFNVDFIMVSWMIFTIWKLPYIVKQKNLKCLKTTAYSMTIWYIKYSMVLNKWKKIKLKSCQFYCRSLSCSYIERGYDSGSITGMELDRGSKITRWIGTKRFETTSCNEKKFSRKDKHKGKKAQPMPPSS